MDSERPRAESARIQPNAAMLVWARESLGLSIEWVARRLGRSIDRVQSWEAGDAIPPQRTLEAIAALYKRPLILFFAQRPPEERYLPTDFRTKPGVALPIGRELSLAIRRARRLQNLALELIGEQAGFAQKDNIELINKWTNADRDTQSELLRNFFGLGAETKVSGKTTEETYRMFRGIAESRGVFVFQFPLPVEEARAFSLTDKNAPVIVISSKELSYGARSFSLFHELSHVLSNSGGLCLMNQSTDEEVRCNYIAGASLVPMAELEQFIETRGISNWSNEDFVEAAKTFKVTRFVILRRLLIGSYISNRVYEQTVKEWEQEPPPKRGDGAPTFLVKKLSESGRAITSLIIDNVRSGALDSTTAARALEIHAGHVNDLLDAGVQQ